MASEASIGGSAGRDIAPDKARVHIWPEYYHQFPYFSFPAVRSGCYPRRYRHEPQSSRALVLVHGLTDSPYYLAPLAEFFHHRLGYDVYLPLLQGHGLKHPRGMAGVSLAEWKNNVRFAIRTAARTSGRVSIGGLSTGGALAVHFGGTEPEVSGDLFLFAPALGLYGGRWGLFSRPLEWLLRTPLARLPDFGRPLVGIHPYRYDRVPLGSAGELARLIGENNPLLDPPCPLLRDKRIFAAWSAADRVIDVRKLVRLQQLAEPGRMVAHVVPAAERLDHACVVLDQPIYGLASKPDAPPLERANPEFALLLESITRFDAG